MRALGPGARRVRRAISAAGRRRGVSMVEMMVAALLLSIGLMGLVQVYVFSFNLTVNTDDQGMAYNLGREALENVTRQGFTGAVDGTTTTYYDGGENVLGSSTNARYQVTTTVSTSSGLRTVAVTVQSVATGSTLYQTNTYLVQSGI